MAIAFGMISILLISPLFSLAIAKMPLDPPEFAIGLALFMAMPTTVSSGAYLSSNRARVAMSVRGGREE